MARKVNLNMHATKIFITAEEFDKFIKDHQDAEDVERYADCTWFPVRTSITETLDIEVLAVPVK